MGDLEMSLSSNSNYLLRCAVLAALAASTAQSAVAADESKDTLDDVVVTGYRHSLAEARNIKKDSDIAKDVIVAEDMAKFPELNLAESLQRLPGVQIQREAGEGRRISLRGMGPDYSRVQLNGMEILGNVDSAQDARGQRSRDRAFDFNIFASELFKRVEVEKTYQAAQKEGGMAGTVGLFTAKPFDYPVGTKGAASVKLGTNQYTKDTQPRVVGLISQNWDNEFGALLSVAYSKRKTTEQGHNTYNYTDTNGIADAVAAGLDISALSPETQAKLLDPNTKIYWPDGNRLSSWNSDQTRLGITAALQWRPSDRALMTLDVLHGEYKTDRDELHLATRPFDSPGSIIWDLAQPAGSVWGPLFQTNSKINALTIDSHNYVTYADVTGVTFGSENRRSFNKNTFNQVALTGEWQLSDTVKIDGHAGYEKSRYATPIDDKLYMRARGNMIASYLPDGRTANFTYDWNTTDPSNYVMDNFYFRGFWNESQLREGALNLTWDFSKGYKLRTGIAYHRFEQGGMDVFNDGDNNGTTPITRGTSVADISYVYSNPWGSWLVGDYNKAFDKYGVAHTLDGAYDIENVSNIIESTVSGFVQMDWDKELFGKRFRGNVGLRGYKTDTRSTGWIQGSNYAYLGTADVSGNYSGVLPALNSVLELTPETLLRFSATQNLNRPTISSIRAQGYASLNDAGQIEASRGDPKLKPFKDTTLDLALEHYFDQEGLVSVGVFHKDIKDLIGGVTKENIPFSETGLPTSLIENLGAGLDPIVKSFSYPINVSETVRVTGAEIAAQTRFTFLPAPFNNLGIVANYTYINADDWFTGISKNSYNSTLFYETKRWGVRGSLSHRSKFYTDRSSDPQSAGTRGYQGSTYIDGAAFLNLSNNVQITLDGINLTNTKEVFFWSQYERMYLATQSGRTVMAGISYKF
jgi:TonB-dependent receptor